MAQQVKNLAATQETQETWVWSLGREAPLEKGWQPTPVFLSGESHGQGSLVGFSPWGHKELDTTKRLRLCLRKKNSTCSLPPVGSVEAASAFKTLKKGRVESSLLDTPPQPPNTTFAGSANYASFHDISYRCLTRRQCYPDQYLQDPCGSVFDSKYEILSRWLSDFSPFRFSIWIPSFKSVPLISVPFPNHAVIFIESVKHITSFLSSHLD